MKKAFNELAGEVVKRMEKEVQAQKEAEEGKREVGGSGGVKENHRKGSPSSVRGNGQPCSIC